MNITKDKLEAMAMREGRLLVEVEEFEKEKVGSIHVKAVSDESRMSLTARKGIVAKVPKSADIPHYNYSFKSEMEAEVGDEIWWSANAAGTILLLKENVRFECDGKEYIIMPYQEVILCKRGEKFFGMNDRVIAKKTKAVVSSLIDLSASSLSEPPPDRFEVVYVPTFHGFYQDERHIIRCDVGDIVKIDANGGVAGKLEDDLRTELGELYFFRTADILAKQTNIYDGQKFNWYMNDEWGQKDTKDIDKELSELIAKKIEEIKQEGYGKETN